MALRPKPVRRSCPTFLRWPRRASPRSNTLTDKINAALVKAAGAAKVRDRLVAAGFDMEPLTPPAQLAASVRADFDRNAATVKQFSIKLQ